MKTVTFAVCTLALCLTQAMAQEFKQRRTAEFVAHESGPEGVVKGAPFSAETYTEFRQTLGDGNVIERKTRGATYRDSEGRVRTEQILGAALAAAPAKGGEIVIIRDPVASVHWILNPALKTGTEMRLGPASMEGAVMRTPGGGGAPGGTVVHQRMPGAGGGAPGGTISHQPMPGADGAVPYSMLEQNANREQLGLQNINGVQAEGTRVTTTIPAGQAGNVRPIQVVSERWYSPQLQMVVRSRHSDPRTGDHVYEMTNIRQGEPPANLFQPPTDYQIQYGRVGRIQQQDADSTNRRRAPAVPRDEM